LKADCLKPKTITKTKRMTEPLRVILGKISLFVFLPVISGVMLGFAALPSKIWYVGFIGFIPLLIAAEKALDRKKPLLVFTLQVFITTVIVFLYMSVWILQSANLGFIIGVVVVIPFVILLVPYILFRKNGSRYAAAYFIAAWLTGEFIQNYFELGSPFANFGHNLGAAPKLIQWYSITGAYGGTLWMLTVNFLIFFLGKAIINKQKDITKKSIFTCSVLVVPVLLSLIMYYSYEEKGRPAEILVVHPSTDNRDVKYRVNIYELMDIYLDIILPQLTKNTEYVVLPETAITNAGWIADYNRNLVFQHWLQKTTDYPNLKLVTGAVTYESIPDVEKIRGYKKNPGIHFSENYQTWYHTYNAALHIEKSRPVQIRVKEGLVPYQEYTPYPLIMPRLAPVGIDFQFARREPNRQVFTAANNRKTAALICYELVYGFKFARAARQGAEAFFVILNEGWYTRAQHVPYQFLQLSVVRAIENRRSIAHSSNLGISAIINQRGEVLARTQSRKGDFLKHQINMNRRPTLASTLGNLPGLTAMAVTLVLLFVEFKHKNSNKKIHNRGGAI